MVELRLPLAIITATGKRQMHTWQWPRRWEDGQGNRNASTTVKFDGTQYTGAHPSNYDVYPRSWHSSTCAPRERLHPHPIFPELSAYVHSKLLTPYPYTHRIPTSWVDIPKNSTAFSTSKPNTDLQRVAKTLRFLTFPSPATPSPRLLLLKLGNAQ